MHAFRFGGGSSPNLHDERLHGRCGVERTVFVRCILTHDDRGIACVRTPRLIDVAVGAAFSWIPLHSRIELLAETSLEMDTCSPKRLPSADEIIFIDYCEYVLYRPVLADVDVSPRASGLAPPTTASSSRIARSEPASPGAIGWFIASYRYPSVIDVTPRSIRDVLCITRSSSEELNHTCSQDPS